jgi:fatty-acyl-CoA synthase
MSAPVYDWLAHHARTTPDKLAAVDIASGRSYSYAQANERASRLARVLAAQFGVRRGDRVAVLAYNSTDEVELLFAGQKLGCIVLPLNWRLAVPELEFIAKDSEPRLLVYQSAFRETALEVARRTGIAAGLDLADGRDCGYEQALAAASSEPLPRPGLSHADPWIIMYTSGTTGRPKGALITHGMMFFNAVHAAMMTGLGPRSVNLTFLPLFHVGGLCLYTAPAVHFGAASYIMRQFDPAEALALLADKAAGITHTFGVPTNLLMMSQLPEFASAELGHIESFGVGGAASPVSLLEIWQGKGVRVQQGWGMTETATLGLMLSSDKALEKIGSSGLPVLHTDIRIVDADGRDCGPGEVGEILIKGPTITPGYWNRPQANETSFVDGWFRTGDAAVADAEGYVTIVDRWKDMYISGGENVYPAEVENVIFRIDGVAECAVIGIPHEKWGEVGRAFVVLKPGVRLGADDIIGACRKELARYKVPAEVRFLAELPHNATGKVTKHALPRN